MNLALTRSILSESIDALGSRNGSRLPALIMQSSSFLAVQQAAAVRLSSTGRLEPSIVERLLMRGTQGYNPVAPAMRMPQLHQLGPLEAAFMAIHSQEQQQLLKIRIEQQARDNAGKAPLSSIYIMAALLANKQQPVGPPVNKPMTIGRQPILLHSTKDDATVSDYQCLVRKQIEVFEATAEDVKAGTQGRNRPIVVGQVGVRCRHCVSLPRRRRGAVYYPARLDRVYQAGQNMAKSHFTDQCQHLGDDTRKELLELCEGRSSVGCGKQYWAETMSSLGVYEDENGLRFTNCLPETS
jgi:hypothetical protein